MEIKVGGKYINKHGDIYTVIGFDGNHVEYIQHNSVNKWTQGLIGFICDTKPYTIKVKATRLAKKMYPEAKEEGGMLILEGEC